VTKQIVKIVGSVGQLVFDLFRQKRLAGFQVQEKIQAAEKQQGKNAK